MAARGRNVALALSLSLSGATIASALAPRAAHAQQGGSQQALAQSYFQRGREQYNARQYAQALENFRAALVLVPSPNTRLYIGLSLRELNQPAAAYRELRAADREARERAVTEPRYGQTATLASDAAAGLQDRIALVVLEAPDVPADTVIRVNGEAIERTVWNTEVAYDPGTITVDANAPGRTPFFTRATLVARRRFNIRVRLGVGGAPAATGASNNGWVVDVGQQQQGGTETARPATAGPTPLIPIGAVSLGVGVVLLLGGTVTGGIALSSWHRINDECGQMVPCMANNLEARVATGNTLVVVTNVGLITGGILAGLGGVLMGVGFAVDSGGGALPTMARVRPYVDPAMGTLGLRGTF